MDILRDHSLGRIVVDDAGDPRALPVNYSADGDDLVVTTRARGSIAHDTTDAMVEWGCSLLMRDQAAAVGVTCKPDDPERLPYPWVEGLRRPLLRIRSESVTERRLIRV